MKMTIPIFYSITIENDQFLKNQNQNQTMNFNIL